jgi:hypothetical protein
MYPDKRADELVERLKRKIEVFIVAFCIIIITICCIYAYIIRPVMDKKVESTVGYEKFKSFSMPIGDIRGTEEYDDKTIATYTDDWGIRHELKERTK